MPNYSGRTQGLVDLQIYQQQKKNRFFLTIIFSKIKAWFSPHFWYYNDESDVEEGDDVNHETGVVDESYGSKVMVMVVVVMVMEQQPTKWSNYEWEVWLDQLFST